MIQLNREQTFKAEAMTKRSSIFRIIKDRIIAIWHKLVLWVYAKSFGLLLALFLSLPKRKRMSHDNGISGLGQFRVVDDPQFPEHEFFKAGREFPLRIRHATATFLDDATNGIRSISIKLSHHHFKSPFDIEMNTGEISLFWSAVSFLQFAKMRKEKYAVCYVDYIRKYPQSIPGALGAMRRDPVSFTNLRYYCKTPFLFIGTDGIKRYAKYRVIPQNKEPETGLQTARSEFEIPNQRVQNLEERGRNFLKYKFEEMVEKGEAKYTMQIQLRMAADDEDQEIFNNMVPWDDRIFPWLDLAHFEITESLDWRESTITSFSVGNMPKSLGLIPARSIFDYNSVNYMRLHSEIARKARLLSIRLFGMVPGIPDNDNRNAEDFGV